MYSNTKNNNAGFGALVVIVLVLVVATVGLFGYLTLHKKDSVANSTHTAQNLTIRKEQTNTNSDPYVGWKTATSVRAGFSIKYPTSWKLDNIVGKDNIEYIILNTDHFNITINSYIGTNPGDGGQTATTCEDCQMTITTTPFNAGSVGTLNLQTIAFNLDSGSGKAMVIRKTDGTYYIPSPSKPGVVTSFRGLSKLSSLDYYQDQTSDQFMKNPDYTTAQKILESLTY